MVYKRYINKDGKSYGPYDYRSVKKDGKVISEYVGKGVKKELKNKIICSKNCFRALIIILIVLVLMQIFLLDITLTSHASLSLEETYFLGDKIDGNVKLNVREGELIPAGSKVVIKNGGEVYEYILSDLISDEIVEGNYFADGVSLSGYGSGYGVAGEKKIYPEINFVFNVYSSDGESAVSENAAEENESAEEIVLEENETAEEIVSEENAAGTEILEEVPEENIETPTETVPEVSETPTESDPVSAESSDSSSGITGNAVDAGGEISGSVSYENSYEYILSDGETAELKSGSVKISKNITDDSEIDFDVVDNKVVVSTNYYETETGYGEEFAGDKEETIKIDLADLNIPAKEGALSIEIIYENNSIVSIEENIEIKLKDKELEEMNLTEINESIREISLQNINVSTTQYGAVVGMPVKWKKKISLENSTNLSVALPAEAENISVYKIADSDGENENIEEVETAIITGGVTADANLGEKSTIVSFFKKIFGRITGNVVDVEKTLDEVNILIEENATDYEIEYETPGPVAVEDTTSKGKYVTISSDIHYENILAYTELPYEVSLGEIKLYHIENGIKNSVEFQAYDSEGNLVDGSLVGVHDDKIVLDEYQSNSEIYSNADSYVGGENITIKEILNESIGIEENVLVENNTVSFITWVVPHTSEQVYEIVISATGAEHLDANKNFVKDIYNEIKSQDGNWSGEIPSGDYVRVSFEENLTNINDITIYARSSDGVSNGRIEIYLENGNEIISSIEGINQEGLYKTYLTNLSEGENYKTFDLKILGDGQGIDFDWIVDPYYLNTTTNATGSNITIEPGDVAHLNISDGSLILYLPFDINHTSDNKTYDYSNSSYDGTATGGATWNSSGGVYGGAYTFDGTDDYISLASTNFGTNYTISAWVNMKVFSDEIFMSTGSSANYINLRTSAQIDHRFSSGTAVAFAGLSLPTNSYFHFVITRNYTTLNLYVNGFQNGTQTAASNGDFVINRIGGYPGVFPNGTMDEIVVFNKTLSATEVAQIYNGSYSRFYPTGELLFQNLNFGTNNIVNITLDSCQTNNESYIQGKINSGSYQNFSGCSLLNYDLTGLSGLTSANLSVKFLSTPYNFYSPLVAGNVSVADFINDTTAPTITFESPTPENASTVNSATQTITANISDSSNQNTSSFIDFNRGLVGYWAMDYYNATGIYDNSSYSNFGTFAGGVSGSNLSTGARGYGLSFDGTDDYITIPSSSSLNLSTAMTVSAWIYDKGPSPTYRMVAAKANSWFVTVSSGVLYCAVWNTTGVAIQDANMGAIPTNSWTHVVMVFNGTDTLSYINGIYTDKFYLGTNMATNTNAVSIGRRSAGENFNGTIDEVLIFNRSLSSSEILALYNSQTNKFNATFTNLADTTQHNYTLYAIDSAGNLNSSTRNFLTNFDITAPNVTINSPTNQTYTSASVLFNVTATDGTAISACVYSLDSLANVSLTNIAGTNFYNATNSSMTDGNHNVSFYCNDSSGNLNLTSEYFSVDTTAPTYSSNQSNSSIAGQTTLFSLYVNDGFALQTNGGYIFSTNNSGEWVNDSAVNFTSTPEWANVTKTLNSTGSLLIGYRWFLTDNVLNANNTPIYVLTTNDTTAPEVTISLPTSGQIFTSSSVTLQATTNENSTCNYSVNAGTTNSSLTANSAGTIHTATATISTDGDYVANYYCADLYGNANNTKNVSFSVAIPVSSPGTGGSTGGGGGGSITTTTPAVSDFSVSPPSVERTLAVNRIELGQIEIENNADSSRTFNVKVEVLNSMISFEQNSITVDAKGSGKFEFRITPPDEVGIYTGKIIITAGSMKKEIPVGINVKTEKSLYDIVVTIPKSLKVLSLGENLFAQIDLLQMGIKEKMDVTLNYVVKDFSGKVYLVESETIAVENQKVVEKEFNTDELPAGDYVLGIELIYPDGVAVASSQFQVKEKVLIEKKNAVMILVLASLAFISLVIFLIVRRYRKALKAISKKK